MREGSLEAPTRHALDWTNPDFYNEEKLFEELERIFDICHGCRRCVSLCDAYPTLFDLVDESDIENVPSIAALLVSTLLIFTLSADGSTPSKTVTCALIGVTS